MKSQALNDQLFIDLLFKHDKKAFALLYDTYSPSLHGSIINIVANKELAAQILQKVFLYAWETIHSYDRHNLKLFTWLFHNARRISVETMRSIDAWPTVSQLEEIAGGMRSILKNMDAGHRQVIELMYYKGFTKNQVAETLNIPIDTVTALLHQGMALLHQNLNAFIARQ